MKNSISIASITTLLAAYTPAILADNRVPAELAETITPHYRYEDIQCFSGAQFVWIKQMDGHDEQGRLHTLFKDRQGALLPLNRLSAAFQLINPLTVKQKGQYHDLLVQLHDKMVVVRDNTSHILPLPENTSTLMTLRGGITVNKFDITATTLTPTRSSEGVVPR